MPRQDERHLLDAHVASSLDGGLREFPQDHHLRQGRNATQTPNPGIAPDGLCDFGRELKRQAFVSAGMMVVGTGVLVAGMPHQERPWDELINAPPRTTAK